MFKEFDPERKGDDDFESEDLGEMDEEIDLKEADYGKKPDWAKTRPIRKDESLKHKQ